MTRWQMEGLLIGFKKGKMALPSGHYLSPDHGKHLGGIDTKELTPSQKLQQLVAWFVKLF